MFSGIALAAIGRSSPDDPTPLQALFGFPKLSDESSQEFGWLNSLSGGGKHNRSGIQANHSSVSRSGRTAAQLMIP